MVLDVGDLLSLNSLAIPGVVFNSPLQVQNLLPELHSKRTLVGKQNGVRQVRLICCCGAVCSAWHQGIVQHYVVKDRQRNTGHIQRARVETLTGRWKSVIRETLRSSTLDKQRTESRIGVSVQDKMNSLGSPTLERIS